MMTQCRTCSRHTNPDASARQEVEGTNVPPCCMHVLPSSEVPAAVSPRQRTATCIPQKTTVLFGESYSLSLAPPSMTLPTAVLMSLPMTISVSLQVSRTSAPFPFSTRATVVFGRCCPLHRKGACRLHFSINLSCCLGKADSWGVMDGVVGTTSMTTRCGPSVMMGQKTLRNEKRMQWPELHRSSYLKPNEGTTAPGWRRENLVS